MDTVHLNIGGSMFQTTFETLAKIPDTKLSGLRPDLSSKDSPASFFFDRNPDVFNSILDLYRTGELHFPSNICGATLRTELEFWQIDKKYLSECCLEAFYKHESNLSILMEIKNLEKSKVLDVPIEECREGCWRNSIWRILQYPQSSRKASVFNTLYMLIVVLSTAVLFISTMADIRKPTDRNSEFKNDTLTTPKTNLYFTTTVPDSIKYIDIFCGIFFTIEYLARLWVTPLKCRHFLCTPPNVVDAVCIIAFWILLPLLQMRPESMDGTAFSYVIMILSSASLLRLFRFYRFMNRFQSFDVINLAARGSTYQFGILIAIFFLSNLFFGYLIYYVEFEDHNAISNAFTGLWWAFITMTTVGYGDVVPKYFLGRIVGVLCALTGIIMLAIPVAVVTSNFTVYYNKLKDYSNHEKAKKKENKSKCKLKPGSESKSVSPIHVLTLETIESHKNRVEIGKSKKLSVSHK